MFPYIQRRIVVKTNHIFKRKIVYHLCKNINGNNIKGKIKNILNIQR